MKAAIIIYSKTGHTEEMAEIIRSQLEKEGVKARIFNIENAGIDYEYIKEAEGIITGSPTYLSSAHWRMMKFLSEDSVSLSLSGKLAAVFATAHYAQGGADGALIEMIGSLLVRGCLLYSSGSAEGLPFIHHGPVALDREEGCYERSKETFSVFASRFARKMKEIFS